jgi:hypothetical protein
MYVYMHTYMYMRPSQHGSDHMKLTEAPAKVLTSIGVMNTAVTVDAKVIRTDTGRSPPAMKVATLEA